MRPWRSCVTGLRWFPRIARRELGSPHYGRTFRPDLGSRGGIYELFMTFLRVALVRRGCLDHMHGLSRRLVEPAGESPLATDFDDLRPDGRRHAERDAER
jgi:hypothetical protein